MQLLLVKVGSYIKDGKVGTFFYINNNIGLQRKRVGVKHYQVIKFFDIYNYLDFLLDPSF